MNPDTEYEAAIAELARYTGEPPATVRAIMRESARALTREWEAAVSDVTNQEQVRSYYAGSRHYIYELTEFNYTHPCPAEWRRLARELCAPLARQGARVLDYGGGIGSLLMALGDLRSLELHYADVPGHTFDYARSRFETRGLRVAMHPVRDEEPLVDEAFDVIFCFDVIEHLVDPLRQAKYLVSHLRPGGLLVVTVNFTTNETGKQHLNCDRYTDAGFLRSLEGFGLVRENPQVLQPAVFRRDPARLKTPISVCVVTKNEACHLAACLDSVTDWADEIIVVDQASGDDTVSVALRYTPFVYQQDRGAGMEKIYNNRDLTYRKATNAWAMWLDADERVTPELAADIAAFLRDPGGHAATIIHRRTFLLGEELTRGIFAHENHLRLFRRDRYSWARESYDEAPRVDGPQIRLQECILHYPYSSQAGTSLSVTEQMQKFNWSSSNDALFRWRTGGAAPLDRNGLVRGFATRAAELLTATEREGYSAPEFMWHLLYLFLCSLTECKLWELQHHQQVVEVAAGREAEPARALAWSAETPVRPLPPSRETPTRGAAQRELAKPRCPLCGTTLAEVIHRTAEAALVRCLTCGLAFFTPPPSPEGLKALYRHSGPCLEAELAAFRKGEAPQTAIDLIEAHVPGRGRLLDVGCAHGGFLLAARQRGWTVAGFEVSEESAAVARTEHGLDVVCGDHLDEAGLPDGAFDLVTMQHVLEHVPDPLRMLQAARRLLRRDGALWVSTPNLAGLAGTTLGGRWGWVTYPNHLVYFTPTTLCVALQRAGFRVTRLFSRTAGDQLPLARELLSRIGPGRGGSPAGVSVEELDRHLRGAELIAVATPEAVQAHAPAPSVPAPARVALAHGGPIRLNLGCGGDRKPGYINVDAHAPGADSRMSIFALEFPDGTVDEIASSHMLEHLDRFEIPRALREWHRALKPGRRLRLNIPNLEWCVREWLGKPEAERWGWQLDTLFGMQTHAGEYHKTGFTPARIEQLLTEAGFSDIAITPVHSHGQECMAVEARKGEGVSMDENRGQAVTFAESGLRAAGRGEHERAVYELTRALELDPTLIPARAARGLARLALGNAGEGIADLEQSARASGDAAIWNNLGCGYAQAGRLREAEEALREAMRRDSGLAAARTNLGDLFRAQGRLTEARTWYEAALRLDPGEAGAREGLAALRVLEDEEGMRQEARGKSEAQPLALSTQHSALSTSDKPAIRERWIDGPAVGWGDLYGHPEVRRVLDFGCGEKGTIPYEQFPRWEFTGLDRFPPRNLQRAFPANARYVQYEGEQIPFPDGHFDFIVANFVLEHVRRPREVLGELTRVLKRNGFLYAAVPNAVSMADAIYRRSVLPEDEGGHEFKYTFRSFLKLAYEMGFRLLGFQEGVEESLAWVAQEKQNTRFDWLACYDYYAREYGINLRADSYYTFMLQHVGVSGFRVYNDFMAEDRQEARGKRQEEERHGQEARGKSESQHSAFSTQHSALAGPQPPTPDPDEDLSVLVQTGAEHLAAGRAAEAAEAFRAVLAAAPDLGEARGALGTALLNLGQIAEALTELSAAAQALGTSEAWNNLGCAHAVGGRAEEARAAFLKAIEIDGKNLEPQRNLAGLFEALGMPAEAAAAYNLLLLTAPDDPEALAGKARCAVVAGVGACAGLPAEAAGIAGLPAEIARAIAERAAAGPRLPGLSAHLLVRNEVELIDLYLDNTLPYVDELIVIDGGSTDGTIERIRARKSEKVRLFVWPQAGAQFTPGWREPDRRNACIALTGREWILKKDVDEFFREADYEKIRAVIATPRDALCCFPRINFWGDPDHVRLSTAEDPHWSPDPQGNLWRGDLGLRWNDQALHCQLATGGAVYTRTEVCQEIPIYHYHWALGKRVKVNDLRRGDLVADFGVVPPEAEDRAVDPAAVQWDRPGVRVARFWDRHPETIERHLGRDMAAQHERNLRDLAAYFGRPYEEVKQQYWHSVPALTEEWRAKNPRSEAQIKAFYAETEGYIYNLTNWHALEGRRDWPLFIGRLCDQHGVRTILDYGCGVVDDAMTLAARGFAVTAVDLEGRTLEFARWRAARAGSPIAIRAIEREVDVAGTFDALICFDVVGHVKRPIEFLRRLMPRVAVGGLFIVSNDCDDMQGEHPMHLAENNDKLEQVFSAFEADGCWVEVARHEVITAYRREAPDEAGPAERIDRLVATGERLFAARKLPRAIACFERAVALDPVADAALFGLGVARLLHGPINEGVAALERAVAIAPNAERWNALGWAYHKVARTDDARQAFEASLALDAGNLQALKNLGHLHREQGRPKEAVAVLQRAVRAGTADEELLGALREALDEQARAAVRAAERERPAEPPKLPHGTRREPRYKAASGGPRATASGITATEHNPKVLAVLTPVNGGGLAVQHDPGGLAVLDQTDARIEMEGAPTTVQIETTSICNARCVICPTRKMERKKTNMSMGEYRLIVDKVAAAGTKAILPFLNGEPFVHPDLVEQVRYAAARVPHVRIFTNMSLTTEAKARAILDAGIHHITMSLDSIEPDKYPKYRVGLEFDRVMANVRTLARLKREGNYSVTLDAVLLHTDDPGEQRRIVEFFGELGIDYGMTIPFNWAGQNEQFKRRFVRKPCIRPFRDLTVLVDGQVCLCCLDYEGVVNLGNIFTDDLDAIWNGPILTKLRADHMAGRYPGLCGPCDAEFHA